jgi:hypothetical protein
MSTFAGIDPTNPVLLDSRKPPWRPRTMESHQLWVWMNGPGAPHWEVRGTGVFMEEEEFICGETQDHDLVSDGPVDGITIHECRRCGAEIIEDEADETT